MKLSSSCSYCHFYISVAVTNNDPSICLKVPEGSKGDCMEQIAIKNKNLSLCAQIGGPVGLHCAQQFVQSISKENYTLQLCEDLTKIGAGTGGPSPNQCFYEVATRTLNLAVCDKIVGEDSAKNDCKTLVQHALSIN